MKRNPLTNLTTVRFYLFYSSLILYASWIKVADANCRVWIWQCPKPCRLSWNKPLIGNSYTSSPLLQARFFFLMSPFHSLHPPFLCIFKTSPCGVRNLLRFLGITLLAYPGVLLRIIYTRRNSHTSPSARLRNAFWVSSFIGLAGTLRRK